MSDDDITGRLENFDELLDGMKQISETMTGAARSLMAEGWTEQQARDIVVAVFVRAAREATR